MDKRGYAVNTRHADMRWRVRAKHDAFLVYVSLILEASVSGRAIGMHGCPGLNDIFHKRDDLTFRWRGKVTCLMLCIL